MSDGGEAEASVEAASRAVDIVGLEPAAVAGDSAQPGLEGASPEPGGPEAGIPGEEVEGERPFEDGRGVAEGLPELVGPLVVLFRPGPEVTVRDGAETAVLGRAGEGGEHLPLPHGGLVDVGEEKRVLPVLVERGFGRSRTVEVTDLGRRRQHTVYTGSRLDGRPPVSEATGKTPDEFDRLDHIRRLR